MTTLAAWIVAALVLQGICAPNLNAKSSRPPNLVLILADDLGWTDLGCFGSDLYETPNIDRLAKRGVRFTNAYAACHVCSPTRASLLTGKSPARLHLTDYIPGGKDRGMRSPEWTKFLPSGERTLAEALRSLGYVNGHFGKWHLNRDKNYRPGRPMDPASQGFDEVLTTVKPKSSDSPTGDPHHVAQITDAANDFIDRHRAGPFFCYVSHNTVHRPVIGQPDIVERFRDRVRPDGHHQSPKYAAMVHDMDQSVGRIVSQLDKLGLSNDTLVLFLSDNGGFLGDARDRGTSNHPLRGGKGTNFEGGVRVPAIACWPGRVAEDQLCHEPIISTDWFSTILQLAGAEPLASDGSTDGVSLCSLLDDPTSHLEPRALYWHYPHYHALGATPHSAIRSGDWKLIEFFEDGHRELYNLRNDLGEQNDLSAEMPQIADRLSGKLQAWRAEVDAQLPVAP